VSWAGTFEFCFCESDSHMLGIGFYSCVHRGTSVAFADIKVDCELSHVISQCSCFFGLAIYRDEHMPSNALLSEK